jgi:hypothetical protein
MISNINVALGYAKKQETEMFTNGLWKGALTATLVCFGLAGAAEASTISGTFGLDVYQFTCASCNIGSSDQAATLANVAAHSGDLAGSGQFVGALNLSQSGTGDGNIGTFLSSGGTNNLGATVNGLPLSSAPFGITTIMVFTANTGASTGSITHDDGIGLYNSANVLLTGDPATIPTATPSATSPVGYTLTLADGAWRLVYVEANGLPAVLDFEAITGNASTTPIPAALPLFASGLGVLGLFGRRRKRKNAAALAAA